MVDTRHDEPITYDVLPDGSVDPVYQAKAELLNDSIQQIGMGKYQVNFLFYLLGVDLPVPVAFICSCRVWMACRYSMDRCCRSHFGSGHSRVSSSRPFLDFGHEHWPVSRGDGLEHGK